METPLVELSETEVQLNFELNSKCRTTIHLRSLSATATTAFKVQTSSPHKFLVNPPTGLIPPLSFTDFQIILKPQSQIPPSFPRSSDRFLIKTAPFDSSLMAVEPDSVNSLFSSLPRCSTQDFKLKVAFVGPFLLRRGVVSGNVDSVRNIIKRQRTILAEFPPREAESLLRLATELADPEDMVNLLLEAGLKIDARVKPDDVGGGFHRVHNKWKSKGWNELHVAVVFDRTDEALNLLNRFGPLDLRDKEGRTPLHLAASTGNIRCARTLIESGADKDAKSKDGRTALCRVARNGDRRMVEMLIEMGADPTITDDHGRSAFDVAREKGHEEIVEVLERGEAVLTAARRGNLKQLESLLQKGGSTRYRDQYGLIALHAAAFKGHKKIVSMLVEFGVELECQDNDGHVPLHLAVEGGDLETVEELVNRGANVNAMNNNGVTPLYMAKMIGYDDISEFLESRGASFSYPSSLEVSVLNATVLML